MDLGTQGVDLRTQRVDLKPQVLTKMFPLFRPAGGPTHKKLRPDGSYIPYISSSHIHEETPSSHIHKDWALHACGLGAARCMSKSFSFAKYKYRQKHFLF